MQGETFAEKFDNMLRARAVSIIKEELDDAFKSAVARAQARIATDFMKEFQAEITHDRSKLQTVATVKISDLEIDTKIWGR